jgi:predicted cupin superfamily sugar epimerase
MNKADFYIEYLNLKPHPEGGYFSEVYRSEEEITILPDRYSGSRCFSTSIYFLLKGKQVSNFHKLKSDEIWHFYDGSSVKIYTIDAGGNLNEIILGKQINDGDVLQTVIKRDHWFCAELINKNSFALVGCNVAPGFDFADFVPGARNELIKQFPRHKTLIESFT